MQADLILFWVFAPISVASAIAMLVMRNAVHSALFLIVNFFCLALFYLILGATFLFAVQIIVYAGAIMVLFLFVIMLLGVDGREDLRERRLIAQRPVAIALGVAFVLEVTFAIRASIGFSALAPGRVRQGQRGRERAGAREGAVQQVLLPVRGDVDPADHRGDRRDDPGAAQVARRHPGGDGSAQRGAGAGRAGAGGMSTPISYFLVLSSILFAIGSVGVLTRKNALIIFMSVELQLNAVNLTLVAFSRMHNSLNGQVLAFFSMVVAAAEVVVGLAIIVSVYRRIRSVNVDDAEALRG